MALRLFSFLLSALTVTFLFFNIPVQAASSALKIQVPETVDVAAGPFITGSGKSERELGYSLDEAAYGHTVTRDSRWYDFESNRHKITLPAFRITKNLITNALYAVFVSQTSHRAPDVSKKTWGSYRLAHPYNRTRRHAWQNNQPPKGRMQHPVVLVSLKDAETFAKWLSAQTNQKWRLPVEKEWEKAARGTNGNIFPWGNTYKPNLLNSHDKGPFDTVPIGTFPQGASPYGMLDAAGQVFEWTATATSKNRRLVKGGSWDDKGCGVCRSAARHGRPTHLKHILIGFRLVLETPR